MRTNRGLAVLTTAVLLVPTSTLPADAASPVRLVRAQYDSPGADDGSNKSLNAEWVKITNHSKKRRALTGWTLRDKQKHIYRFPKLTLKPGASVWVHTGSGTNTRRHLYWRENYYVWNNTGDKAILKNKGGSTVDTCTWDDADTEDNINATSC